MARDATETREKLLRAAEHLFARHGLDVPIREIHALAGQKNASAIQYHFGSKEDLVQAIIERHAPTPADMVAVGTDLEGRRDDPRSFVGAIVRRLCGYLADEESRDYIRFSFHLMQQTSMRAVLARESDHHSMAAVYAETDLVRSMFPGLPERLVRERAVAGISFIALEVAERARLIDDASTEGVLDEEEFIANLVDMATAILTAPSSLA
ncbi:MAG: TetR/AcrR family transcriptional regulator [Actinomycetia bacterium]|nr:TetR/AcrR family transcriptional regulator [Actinomycetes bacterium]